MGTYDQEEWRELYRKALVELEHAKMIGRIGAARTSIMARIEKLLHMPGLHDVEREAIKEALRNLRVLERDEERYRADEARIAARALESLYVLAPKLGDSHTS